MINLQVQKSEQVPRTKQETTLRATELGRECSRQEHPTVPTLESKLSAGLAPAFPRHRLLGREKVSTVVASRAICHERQRRRKQKKKAWCRHLLWQKGDARGEVCNITKRHHNHLSAPLNINTGFEERRFDAVFLDIDKLLHEVGGWYVAVQGNEAWKCSWRLRAKVCNVALKSISNLTFWKYKLKSKIDT